MKKLMLGLAPLLVVAAFAAMPVIASANTTLYGVCEASKGHAKEGPCKVEEKFTAFGAKEKAVAVTSRKATGSGNFVLKGSATIECKSFTDTGKLWNAGTPSVGHSEDSLVFDECSITTGALKGCVVSSSGTGNEITGTITNEVEPGGVTVKITIVSGFVVKVTGVGGAACEAEKGVEVGKVSGTAVGSQPENSAVLTFTAASGLTFAAEPATITGSDETLDGTKLVFIN